ncbi:oncostatin-M-specific receptor subunit beta [Silurus meridionalis]|uniref:oncostatin-M-specific receptor subunit beta n=1 Tax=Silurus meridionalis TaxID=175797 RepID=UPI001EEAC6E5|nr:oncostatin-M-specific receptor subunit beta [Silurus meridionalis]
MSFSSVWRVFYAEFPLSEMQRFFYSGLLMGFILTTRTISAAGAATVDCSNIKSYKERCNVTKESQGLSCFGHRTAETITTYHCLWSPGQYDKIDLFLVQRICKPVTNKTFGPGPNQSMTVYAIAQSTDQKRCAFAEFSSHPSLIIRCGPPASVTFKRGYGHLNVTAEWEDSKVEYYHLKYRERNSTMWKEVKSHDSKDCTVKDVVASQSYEMQIQCVANTDCPLCPLSNVISVPQELFDAPVIKETHYELVQNGQRKITVKWEYVHSHAVDGYNVAVQKASGEPAETSSFLLKAKTITLFLCYSAYKLSISAFNEAGLSPAAHLDIDTMKEQTGLNSTFSVILISKNNFNLSWNHMLSRKYPCYSVEWWANNEKIAYKSFYEKKNYHTVETQHGLFQPYKRYDFFLHVRHEKETCNLKNVNNSDQTYGRTRVYLTEGTPIVAPGNVNSSNITQSSFVITWSPVPEEDLRGFLQGYIIHYTQDSSKNNITVHPNKTSCKLTNLRSGGIYCVQVSACTAAGEGKRSKSMCFETLDSVAIGGMLAGVTAGVVALLLATHICIRLLKRSKKMLWPSIPNPCNSNAVQKIEGGQELEVMELMCRPNLEETEVHVSVLDGKQEAHSACNAQDHTKTSLLPNVAPPSVDKVPISPSTTSTKVDFMPELFFSIDSNNPQDFIEKRLWEPAT